MYIHFVCRHFSQLLFFIFTPSHIYAKGIFNGSPEMRTLFPKKMLSWEKKFTLTFLFLFRVVWVPETESGLKTALESFPSALAQTQG